ncbi:SnRNP Sm related protein [Giardia duodenalis]|uniref:SnRNP Sm related protein n=1 Tax=Giardia intestinalis TaxID=5741 RepID=V6THV4_GIAIN|nr:SnRNP Sm related protein [Giardia intestinalis]
MGVHSKDISKMKQVLPNCVNYYMVIALKDSTTIQGVLRNVDVQMNMVLSDVTMIDTESKSSHYPTYSLQGSLISSIRIPDRAIKEAASIAASQSMNSSSVTNSQGLPTSQVSRGPKGDYIDVMDL